MKKITLSIIYVYFNTPKELIASISSMKNAIGRNVYEIIMIDNASSRHIPEEIARNKQIKIIKNRTNLGYGSALNQGAKIANGELLLFVNPDTIFEKKSLSFLISKLKSDKTIGIIGPQMRNKKKEILPTISGHPDLPKSLFAFSFLNKLFPRNQFSKKYWLPDHNRTKECTVDVVGGACMMMRKSVFRKAGGFDPRFFMYFEEADLCRRVQKVGLKILYYPKAKIIHLVGRSSADSEWIEHEFEKSRFKYFKKYNNIFYAIFSEVFLRMTKPKGILLSLIFLLSICINLYKINTLMMFFGDFGKDYLSARDLLVFHHIPLVGIQSSVVWLHQGPISVYLIALALFFGHMNPVAPALLYGFLGAVTTMLIYFLGKNMYNEKVGILGSLFFATSPLVIVNTRMPYHTSIIPLFAVVFFLILQKAVNEKKHFFWVFLSFGILLQVELSNAVLVFLLLLLYFLCKPKITKNNAIKSLVGFLLGVFPFILYDLTHHFVQTLGFPLWIINRVRLFFGLTISHNATTGKVFSAILTIINQITGAVFPTSYLITMLFFGLLIFFFFKKKKEIFSKEKKGLLIIILWLLVPICGYIVHAAPSTAYFPVLFPALSLLIGFLFYELRLISRFFILIFLVLVTINIFTTVSHNYFLTTNEKNELIPPAGYNIGTTWTIYDQLAKAIATDAKGKELNIIGEGKAGTFQTNFDNYRYLVLWHGGNVSENAKLTYGIYQDPKEIKKKLQIIYQSRFGTVVRYEKN